MDFGLATVSDRSIVLRRRRIRIELHVDVEYGSDGALGRAK